LTKKIVLDNFIDGENLPLIGNFIDRVLIFAWIVLIYIHTDTQTSNYYVSSVFYLLFSFWTVNYHGSSMGTQLWLKFSLENL